MFLKILQANKSKFYYGHLLNCCGKKLRFIFDKYQQSFVHLRHLIAFAGLFFGVGGNHGD